MKKIFITLLSIALLLSAVGCNQTPPDVSNDTDNQTENSGTKDQLISYVNYDKFSADIYLCDDVYRSDDTPTHGSGSIMLPMAQDVLELIDYDILLCTDACTPVSVVSRASQGYAPAYRVVPDGEIDGNFKVLKFKMEIPEPMLEDIKKQGVYEQIVKEIESQYYYLLVLDEMHYAYIHLEQIDGVEKIENEAELADGIVKNARISFEPKKLDSVEHSHTSDIGTITDIADWDKLPWSESWERWKKGAEGRKAAPNAYNFIYNLVSGESDIPELNGLGIKDYSITLIEDKGHGSESTLSFTFTVTGNSLPETLPPGTYTKNVEEGIDVYIYDNKKPETWEEYVEEERIQRGLGKFGDNPAVQAVDTYLSWRASYEVSPFGEWDMTSYHLPYNYICAYYGESLEISFSEMQRLMSEKFGIAVERPQTEMVHSYSICLYDSETDTVRYADTRGITAVHKILDVREEDGITYVIVQFFADRNRLIPSHKVQYAIGEGEVFLGSEIIEKGNYEPRDIR